MGNKSNTLFWEVFLLHQNCNLAAYQYEITGGKKPCRFSYHLYILFMLNKLFCIYLLYLLLLKVLQNFHKWSQWVIDSRIYHHFLTIILFLFQGLTMLYDESLIWISGFDLMCYLKLTGFCLALHCKRSRSAGMWVTAVQHDRRK